MSILPRNFDTLCSISAVLPSLMMVQIILPFFSDSSEDPVSENPNFRGHWFGCSLLPGTPLNNLKLTLPGDWLIWLHLSFHGHRPCRFRSNDCSCSTAAPGLMLDNFLPIPDAESLPFYPLVLKLVVCVSLPTRLPACHSVRKFECNSESQIANGFLNSLHLACGVEFNFWEIATPS